MRKISILLFCIWIAITACTPKKSTKEESPSSSIKPNASDLPDIMLTALDGKQFNGKNLLGINVILILFQTDCDHCQREAKQIKDHIRSFEKYQLYFVTDGVADQVKKFARDYNLSTEQNVTFAITTVQGILDNFGPISTPSLYIFNSSGKLVHKFNGETDINLILKAL